MTTTMHSSTLRRASAAAAIALALVLAPPAAAQSLAERAAAVREGTIRLSYATRSDVCGHGDGRSVVIRNGSRRTIIGSGVRHTSEGREWEAEPCEAGPARVAVSVANGRPTSLRLYVGGRWRPAGDETTDLGTVPAPEAAEWLLDLAERASGEAASDAILAATLADSVTIWPRLLRIARNEERPRATRKQAVFWLSQAAGDAATAGLDTLATDRSMDREVREQAVFALSQRPRDEGVPALVRIARSNRDPEIRRKALFWLGQSGDPRALALFEELLTK